METTSVWPQGCPFNGDILYIRGVLSIETRSKGILLIETASMTTIGCLSSKLKGTSNCRVFLLMGNLIYSLMKGDNQSLFKFVLIDLLTSCCCCSFLEVVPHVHSKAPGTGCCPISGRPHPKPHPVISRCQAKWCVCWSCFEPFGRLQSSLFQGIKR